ncbi:hypothetical protein [Aquimarina aquimarini]|uniref:hypothetical protein n=1 Tax=Aquimarina aquimarini TaxID=1191734 RepID=UPI000D54FDC5|nr:hypothetical protein [Aquimarina aquimarini]
MQATTKRHIATGHHYDALIPKSIGHDTVIVETGKAQLKDTLKLIQAVIQQTKADSYKLALRLKGNSVMDSCKNIWNFVYRHIQYKMDATGIEQVRRPSRTWADRATGVDCDCYTVFIGSILSNLGIPFMIRITKYGGKSHFQHVYPVVFTEGKQITLDCVTDRFNHEVPYSEKKDIPINNAVLLQGSTTLSGVDIADVSLDALQQKPIPLREIISENTMQYRCATPFKITKQPPVKKQATPIKHGKTSSPFRFDEQQDTSQPTEKDDFKLFNFLMISVISVVAGIGVLKMLAKPPKTSPLKNKKTARKE